MAGDAPQLWDWFFVISYEQPLPLKQQLYKLFISIRWEMCNIVTIYVTAMSLLVHKTRGATENARLENPAPTRRGGKRRNKLYGQPMGQFLKIYWNNSKSYIVIHICNIISKAIATVSICRTSRNI